MRGKGGWMRVDEDEKVVEKVNRQWISGCEKASLSRMY